MNPEDEFRGLTAIRRIIGLGGAVHLDGGRDLLVVGLTKEEERDVDRSLLQAVLERTPELPEAERCRRILFGRMVDKLHDLYRPGVALSVCEAEEALDKCWLESRTSAEAAARFPNFLRELRRAWKTMLKRSAAEETTSP